MMLKPKQKLWLKTRGGRDEEDVIIDEEGYLCVYMYKGYKGYQLIKIPKEEEIKMINRYPHIPRGI